MSGSLWLKRLHRKYDRIPFSDEERAKLDAWQAKVMAALADHPLPPPTPEDLSRADAAIDEADKNGWIPSDPRPNPKLPWIDGIRVWRPKKP